MQSLHVRDLMTESVITLKIDDNLATLYDLMDSGHVRHVPVVDRDGDLVGLVSHRDLLAHALSQETDLPMSVQRDILGGIRVEEIMTSDVETTHPDADIREAAQTMLENKYGCLPVMEGAHLVGILTESDFVRFVAERVGGPRASGNRGSTPRDLKRRGRSPRRVAR
jgi:CBS domain-containing membrane protein